MGLATFNINTRPGATEIVVNGEPIDGKRVIVDSVSGEIPQVTVIRDSAGEITGEGIVNLVNEPENIQVVTDWLASINPELLEQECAARIRAGAREPYKVALQVLQEYAAVTNG